MQYPTVLDVGFNLVLRVFTIVCLNMGFRIRSFFIRAMWEFPKIGDPDIVP